MAHFLVAQKCGATTPREPRNSPHSHQKNTTPNHSLFPKSPRKIMFHHTQKNKKTAAQNHKQTETTHLLQSAHP
jgi:hypothetical protein